MSYAAGPVLTPAQPMLVMGAVAVIISFAGLLPSGAGPLPAQLLIGVAMGVALTHGGYGFAFAWRRLFTHRDGSGPLAHLLMLAAATVLFAPLLSHGELFGHGMFGATAPVDVSVAAGSFLFGVGMQLAGSCASGCLYTAGAGNLRTIWALFFFCAGSFLGSLNLPWWMSLPSLGPLPLGKMLGWNLAAGLQLVVLGGLALLVRRFAPPASSSRLWPQGGAWLRGPWPLPFTAIFLAVLNGLMLIVAGHPLGITWGFTLWGGKLAHALGWIPPAHGFWSWPYPHAALGRGIFTDDTSVFDMGILLGAFLATAAAGRFRIGPRPGLLQLAVAGLGGLFMGYGARLAFGCNIGGLFSGIASLSLRGWEWLLFGLLGTVVGISFRRRFGLPD
ncbi:MAG: YeeE/YedE family protein [Rhodospirillales bacterium]|nr:YeeE/YedE family protein [Rhodospirillales bacterium]